MYVLGGLHYILWTFQCSHCCSVVFSCGETSLLPHFFLYFFLGSIFGKVPQFLANIVSINQLSAAAASFEKRLVSLQFPLPNTGLLFPATQPFHSPLTTPPRLVLPALNPQPKSIKKNAKRYKSDHKMPAFFPTPIGQPKYSFSRWSTIF